MADTFRPATSTNTVGSVSYIVVPDSQVTTTGASVGRAVFRTIASVPKKLDNSIEKAVFAHIQAIRTLGRNTANTAQIAEALALSMSEVERAVANLHRKGVRLANK